MKVYRSISQIRSIKNPILTIGSFDGVHLAHRSIIKLLNHYAYIYKGESVLLSFEPHPRFYFESRNGESSDFKLLSLQEEKEKLLAKCGLQHLIVLPFNSSFAKTKARDFVEDILVEKIGIKKIIVGYNHNFGCDKEGDFEKLKLYGTQYGFSCEQYPEYKIGDLKLSSSEIRKLIAEGNLEEANKLLGYNYFANGVWRSNAFEIQSAKKLMPPQGVYLCKIKLNSRYYHALCDVEKDRIGLRNMEILQEGDALKIRFIKQMSL